MKWLLCIVFAMSLPGVAMADSQRKAAMDQRIVLVTGSTGGLGREVARALVDSGDQVIIHGRDAGRGEALAKELNEDGPGSARFYRADFASLDDVRMLASEITRDYSRLDVIVNNAGIALIKSPARR